MGTDPGNGDDDLDGDGSETDASAFLWPTAIRDVLFFQKRGQA
jgi:hypothetical protein